VIFTTAKVRIIIKSRQPFVNSLALQYNMEEEFYIPESEVTLSMKIVRFYFQRVGWIAPNYTAKLFWKLFTKPRERKLNDSQKEFLSNAITTQHKSDFYKETFTVHKFGTGTKKVLLCHGWEGRTVDFRKVIEGLKDDSDVQIISIDFPGHGSSPESRAHLPMFVDVIDSYLKVAPEIEVIVGHSLGAASIAMAVPKSPDTFKSKKLIFMGLHPIPSQFVSQYKSVAKISEKLFKRCMSLAEAQLQQPLSDYDCHDHVMVYAESEVLLIHDSEDAIIKLRRLEKLHAEIPNSKLFVGDHGGHFKHYRHPDVISEIRAFIS
jgi:pimeloyl-ACP methyl ester carboxylesterase